MTLSTQLVNVGLSPNDGTGDNIRDAFVITNQNIIAINDFLSHGPLLPSLSVSGLTSTNSLESVTAQFSGNVQLLSSTVSTSPLTGALTVNGGVGIHGNLNVGGTIAGNIMSSSIVAGSLTVIGGTALVGNVTAGNIETLGTATIGSDLEVQGSLTVHGNTILITTSEFLIENPTIELGKVANATLSNNDGRDRGVEFFWYDTVANTQQEGFFGFDNATEKFTYIPRATYVGSGDTDVFAGTPGTAVFNTVEADISSIGTSTFNSIEANTITVTNGITGNLATAFQPNVTALGTLSSLGVGGDIQVTSGNIYVQGGAMYIWNGASYVPVSTSAEAFHGGTVALDTTFISGSPSTGLGYGAVQITGTGGLSVGGNLFVGGTVAVNSFTATSLVGNIITPAQPYITSVGTLGNLTVTNAISTGSISSEIGRAHV